MLFRSDDFPLPATASLAAARDRLAKVDGLLVIDGLAYGALTPILPALKPKKLVDLLHHPLCLEAGLTPAQADALAKSEAAALAFADHVIVTSPNTAADVATRFAVSPKKISVAEPGVDRLPEAHGSDIFTIIYVASFTPRKDHPLLLNALAKSLDRPWRLVLVGNPHEGTGYHDEVLGLIEQHRLTKRIEIAGICLPEQLAGYIAASDLMVSSSNFEGYGMALSEGLAAGLPIVAVAGGAVAQTVPGDAGLLVEPGEPDAFAQAIRLMLTDRELYERKRAAARANRLARPGWARTSQIVDACLMELCAREQ